MVALPRRPRIRSPRPWQFPRGRTFLLDNGLRVVMHHLPGQYVVSAGLVLDVPLTSEPAGMEGLAQVAASTLTDGTHAHPAHRFAEAIEACGAVMDASVGYSHVHALIDVPGAHLRTAIRLLAEAVIAPRFADEDVERNKRLHQAHQEQQLATGAGRANHALRRALIASEHRASRSRLGAPGALDAVTGDDVRAHHAHHIGPRRTVLVLSGDFDHGVLDDIIDVFGPWANPDQRIVTHESPTGRPPAAWLIDRPGSVQADIRLGWFTLDRAAPRWPDLQVATNALGGAYLSRLNRVLREEKGFSYGVSLSNAPLRRGGWTAAAGSFRNEVVGEVLALMPDLLDVGTTPITAEEVDRARDYLTGTTPLRYATASGVTLGVLSLIGAGLEPDHVQTQLAAYRAVTPDSATAAAADLIPATQGSLVVVGDAGVLSDTLRAEGWEPTVIASGEWL